MLGQSGLTYNASATNVAKSSSSVTASGLCETMLLALVLHTQLCGAPVSLSRLSRDSLAVPVYARVGNDAHQQKGKRITQEPHARSFRFALPCVFG